MATFGEMTVYCSKRLIDASNQAVSESDVQTAINESIAYWKFRRFWFNEVADTATLTAQNAAFPVPSDFLMPATQDDGFYIEYGNDRRPLSKISQQQYDELFLSNGYGLPCWYARLGGDGYQCYPIPDDAYTVGRHYLKDYTALSATNDTNDFTNNASRLINLWTLGNLITELRQDAAQGDYYRAAAQDEYRNLRVRTDKENSSGKLAIYSNLIGAY